MRGERKENHGFAERKAIFGPYLCVPQEATHTELQLLLAIERVSSQLQIIALIAVAIKYLPRKILNEYTL